MSGKGEFEPAGEIAGPRAPSCIAVGDFNGDGRADLAVLSRSGTVSILGGDGKGGFTRLADLAIEGRAFLLTAGDLLGGPSLELAVATRSKDGPPSLVVYSADGAGGLAERWSFPLDPRSDSLLTQDLDGDGKPDLTEVSAEQGVASVHRGALLRSGE